MGSYDIAFICAGVPPILGACILFLIHKRDEDSSEVDTSIDTDVENKTVYRPPNGGVSNSIYKEPITELRVTEDNDNHAEHSKGMALLCDGAITNDIPKYNPSQLISHPDGCSNSHRPTHFSPNFNGYTSTITYDPDNKIKTSLPPDCRPNGFIRNPSTQIHCSDHTIFETNCLLSGEHRHPDNAIHSSSVVSNGFLPNVADKKERQMITYDDYHTSHATDVGKETTVWFENIIIIMIPWKYPCSNMQELYSVKKKYIYKIK